MNFRTILVPLDGSKNGEASLPYAEAIALGTSAPLRLFRAVEGVQTLEEEPYRAIGEEMQRGQVDEANQYLHATAKASRDRGLSVSIMLEPCDPLEGILAAAADPEIGLIAMATHGRGGVSRLMLGSVADKVMRLATCPTLLVGRVGERNESEPVTLRRIMVPLDGSNTAEAALLPASQLAAAVGATLVLVRAEPWLSVGMAEVGYVPNLPAAEEEVTAAIDEYLGGIQAALPQGIRSERQVIRGFISSALVDAYRSQRADLVVMTTHGRGGLRRLVLGSTADRLVRAGLPTLLIRPEVVAATQVVSQFQSAGAQ